jgi:hypothetical protein
MQLKKQQSNLKRLENTGKRKVMTIDLATRNVVMEEAQEPEEGDDEYEDIKMTPAQRTYLERQREASSSRKPIAEPVATQGSSGTYAHNPYLHRTEAPTFIRGVIPAKAEKKSTVANKASSSKTSAPQKKPSARVQDDRSVHGAEQLLIGGEDGSRDTVIEPVHG